MPKEATSTVTDACRLITGSTGTITRSSMIRPTVGTSQHCINGSIWSVHTRILVQKFHCEPPKITWRWQEIWGFKVHWLAQKEGRVGCFKKRMVVVGQKVRSAVSKKALGRVHCQQILSVIEQPHLTGKYPSSSSKENDIRVVCLRRVVDWHVVDSDMVSCGIACQQLEVTTDGKSLACCNWKWL